MAIYDGYHRSQWDHTALLASYMHNLLAMTNNINAGKKGTRMKFRQLIDFNPFRRKDNNDGSAKPHRVTKKNFSVLRAIGNALVRH